MKKLILVHGMNNQGNSEEEIKSAWLDAIGRGSGKGRDWARRLREHTAAPFYGDKLFTATTGKQAVPLGALTEVAAFDEVLDAALARIEGGGQPSEIAAELDSLNRVESLGAGFHKIWIKTTVRMIEKLSPAHGKVALRFLKQAHAYIEKPAVAATVDPIVRAAMRESSNAVIVAHSLGTIVTYKLLQAFSDEGIPRDSPLYVTLGSPLGISVVKEVFRAPRGKTKNVRRWVNGADKSDFVALHPELTDETFGPGVDKNYPDIRNRYEDPHSIEDYLSNQLIANEIVSLLDV
jgi:hypothetical protein